MNRKGMFAMLNGLINPYKVYPDTAPEGAVKPYALYAHNTNSRDRTLKGKTSGKDDTWRITIVGDNREQCDTVSELLDVLDGFSNNDFQGVHILTVSDEPVYFKSNISRTFIDIKTYDR